MKLTNNFQKLLCINAIFLLSLVALLAGVWLTKLERLPSLEPAQSSVYLSGAIQHGSSEIAMPLKSATYSTVLALHDERRIRGERRRWNEVQSLSEEDLYVNYVYEIAHFNYPNIDPDRVCAIIYHESRFDPNARNEKTGVEGLTQINPKWHSKRAERLGVTNLYSPYGNILVCFDILNELAEDNGMDYALNFFAGGYPYANRYRNSTSPFIKELDEISATNNFSERVLPYYICDLLGGEMDAAG